MIHSLPLPAAGRRPLAVAIALSLLAHAALLLSRPEAGSPPQPADSALRVQLRAAESAPPARQQAAPRPTEAKPASARPAIQAAPATRAPRVQPQTAPSGAPLVPPPADDTTRPVLTLDGLRRQVREQAAAAPEQKAAPLPADPAKTKMARSIERAEKPDCKTRYAGLGLLAIPVLAVQSAREDGCNW